MIMTLTHNRKSANFDLNVSGASWKHHGKKNVEEYTIIRKTNLISPFDKIFIKRYKRKTATGHNLLLHRVRIPHTPLFFDYSQEDSWQYYIFEYLDRCQLFSDNCENSRVHHDKSMDVELLKAIIKSVLSAFEEINSQGFYYPDLCYKNIMVDYISKNSYLIDIDSCLPLSDKKLATANFGSQTWWTLFAMKNLKKIKYLNQTMAISFVLVLCQAISKLKLNSSQKMNLTETIFRASPDQQKVLFNILDQKKESDFRHIFKTPSSLHVQISYHFKSWESIIGRMQKGEDISWEEINAFVNRHILVTGHFAPVSK